MTSEAAAREFAGRRHGVIIGGANDTGFGLAAAVWSRDGAKALRIARRIRAGTVWVNAEPKSLFVAL